ncbi:DUF1998 domain-containing protein [Cryptosporangium phraense]|uniref:DUF1998 domain-containing protein n=2 Tax=Cryptosporangium phraense TaxID=2593070 RepID=A0A545ARE9_9ACTN|nr:DUF1998 domain-containing protein [Cryptosporangium phraense]
MRRAQLVTPFGVGAMSVLVDGTSVITAGLDHWYDVDNPDTLKIDEYQAHDWRLEARLKVAEFRLPPDYRYKGAGNDPRNVGLTVPVLRFPRWSFCMYCKRLEKSPLTLQTRMFCPDPSHTSKGKKGPRMAQVPFVAICARGHLDDFPFNEWVHRSHTPSCSGQLYLTSRGGGGLEGQIVECRKCNKERSLRGITEGGRGDGSSGERTVLTDQLVSRDEPYNCPGSRPWLGQGAAPGTCGEPIRGALRAAGNVYFPKVESSIYLPRKEGAVSAEVHALLKQPAVEVAMKFVHRFVGAQATADMLRENLESALAAELVTPLSHEDLLAGYRDRFGIGEDQPEAEEEGETELLTGSDEWRYPEFQHIREKPKDALLSASDPGLDSALTSHLGRVRSVDVLRETRALRGFTRVRDDALRLSAGKQMLRRKSLVPAQDWLPAYVVKGEGIFFELDAERLAAWEKRAEIQHRATMITDRYGEVAASRGLQKRVLIPRFVLLHTLAHLVINELVFACGYSSASLRERLYVSDAPGREMAGLLIYTAAGDSEGTMGGLVRMARPGNLRSVFSSALGDAQWCSTDPVCMDAGEKGQGPQSCNLAACHGCALLPETSCEEFNRFLDRGLVVGTFADRSIGFFSDASFS